MAQNNHIISLAEFQTLARPSSVHLEEPEVMAYVREAEDVDVKPLIGVDVFNTLVNASVPTSELTPEQLILFKGGNYACACGTKECAGLKRAVAYLAYARMIAANGGMVARTGYYQHDDNYSSRMDDKNRANARRDVQNMAEYYLGSCVEYWNSVNAGCSGGKVARGKLVRIKSIGKISH